MKVAIVGAGAVGTGIARMFGNVVLYDEPKRVGTRAEVNGADVAFVCVPTPSGADGACDTSIVEEVMSWLSTPLIILRSTVSVGTTRRLVENYRKDIVFQPEYGPAATPDHPFNDLRKVRWIILGGERRATKAAARVWQATYSSDITIMQTSYEAAELCKYMENAFLATKVTFCNEFYDIATAFGVDYDELRELWLLDPRIGRSHTFVFPDDRGFGGNCLPKDLAAIVTSAAEAGTDPTLLREVLATNDRIRAAARQRVSRGEPSPPRSRSRS